MALEKYIEILKASGNKLTRQRKLLLEHLTHIQQPVSARDLQRRIGSEDEDEKIDQVTIYRILETFRSIGLVHQVTPTGEYLLCDHVDCNHGFHVMLRCQDCEKYEEREVPDDFILPLRWYLKNQLNFKAHRHVFQMDGLCENCQRKSELTSEVNK